MLKLAPKSSNASFAEYFLGLALLRSGQINEAEKHLKQAAAKENKDIPADVHMGLAEIYSKSQRYQETIDQLELYQYFSGNGSHINLLRLVFQLVL